MSTLFGRAAFRHRKSAFAGFVIRQAFGRASGMLPIRRVVEGRHVLAFHHPVPGFVPVHLLLVPKMALPSLRHLTEVQRAQIAAEVEQLAPEALDNIAASESGFLVFVNGGPRQDLRQVHFHLVTEGYELAHAPSDVQSGVWTELTDPTCELHRARAGDHPLLAGLTHAAEHHDALRLERRGYSIVWDARARDSDGVVHLTAGMPRALP